MPIGNWLAILPNEHWQTKNKKFDLIIDPWVDCDHRGFTMRTNDIGKHTRLNCNVVELWVGDRVSGNSEGLFYGSQDFAIRIAMHFMRKNPKGWY